MFAITFYQQPAFSENMFNEAGNIYLKMKSCPK